MKMCGPEENWAKVQKKLKDKNLEEETWKKPHFKNYKYKVTLAHKKTFQKGYILPKL